MMGEATATKPAAVRGASIATVIDYLNKHVGQTVTATQAAIDLQLPPRTVRRVFRLLVANGFVERASGRQAAVVVKAPITGWPRKTRPEKISRAGEAIVEEALKELEEEEIEEEAEEGDEEELEV